MLATFTKRDTLQPRVWVIGILCALVVCSCNSDNSVKEPLQQLTEVRVQDTKGSIVLNDEPLPDAYAYFVDVPLSDVVKIVLSGVHPTEKIEMEVTATRDGQGNIVFEGEQMVEDVRHIQVKGLYSASLSDDDASEKPAMTRINVSYTVPNSMFSKEYVIPFDGNNGFCYNRDVGQYPMSHADIDAQRDSCDWICKRINSELAKNIRSLSFKFDDNGLLTLGYTTTGLDVFRQTFRYWVSIDELEGECLIDIENPDLFYEFLLNALNVNENTSVNLPYLTEYETAQIHIDGNDHKNNYQFSRVIAVRDDLQYKIFHYLYEAFADKCAWSDKERNYIDTIERITRQTYSPREDLIARYVWAFAIHDDHNVLP